MKYSQFKLEKITELSKLTNKEAKKLLEINKAKARFLKDNPAKGGLESWLKRIKWEGSLEDALSINSPVDKVALVNGQYALNYIWIRDDNGRVLKQGLDVAQVRDGDISLEAKHWFTPSIKQRKSLKFDTNNGIITAVRKLQYNQDQPLEEIPFRGAVGTGFLISTTANNNIVILHLTEC